MLFDIDRKITILNKIFTFLQNINHCRDNNECGSNQISNFIIFLENYIQCEEISKSNNNNEIENNNNNNNIFKTCIDVYLMKQLICFYENVPDCATLRFYNLLSDYDELVNSMNDKICDVNEIC